MELVMELMNRRKSSIPWERIVRGCMILSMIGMLCIGSWNNEKRCVVRYQGDIINPGAGFPVFSQSAKAVRRNAKDILWEAGADRGIPAEIQETKIGTLLNTEEGFTEIKESEPIALPSAGDNGNVIHPTLPAEEEPVRVLPVVKEGNEIPSVVKEGNEIPVTGEGKKEDTLIISEDEKEATIKEEEVDTEDTGDAGESGIKEISGFLIDMDGYITGVTENLNLIDGILLFPWDESCVGIRTRALRELAGCVEEIYLPANIREIEPGSLDELASLAYIEVAEDHPYYYSEDGILYPR